MADFASELNRMIDAAKTEAGSFDEFHTMALALSDGARSLMDVVFDHRLWGLASKLPPEGRVGMSWRNTYSGEGLLTEDAEFFYCVDGIEYQVQFSQWDGVEDGWPRAIIDAQIRAGVCRSEAEFNTRFGNDVLGCGDGGFFDRCFELIVDYRAHYGRDETETADFPATPLFLR